MGDVVTATQQRPTRSQKLGRLEVIDGIRGWASFAVVLFHLFAETFGALFTNFRSSWTYFLMNGPLAVSVFFVLSGDALSASFFRSSGTRPIDHLVMKRYPRLAIPILGSCSLCYLLMVSGLTFNLAAAQVVHRSDWLGTFLAFAPSSKHMLRYSLVTVFTDNGQRSSHNYNAFLWPMSIELVGSMLVFLYLYLFERLRSPLTTLAVLFTVLFSFKLHYAAFFVGVYFGYLRSTGVLDRVRLIRNWRPISLMVVLGIVVFDTRLRYSPIDRVWLNTPIAAGLVFCFYSNDWFSGFFENRVSRWLGRLSFPLYLCQFSIIVSLTSYLILTVSHSAPLTQGSALSIIAASLIAIFATATIFVTLERWTLVACNTLIRRTFKSN